MWLSMWGSEIKQRQGPLTPIWSDAHTHTNTVIMRSGWSFSSCPQPKRKFVPQQLALLCLFWMGCEGLDFAARYSFPFWTFNRPWLILPRNCQYETRGWEFLHFFFLISVVAKYSCNFNHYYYYYLEFSPFLLWDTANNRVQWINLPTWKSRYCRSFTFSTIILITKPLITLLINAAKGIAVLLDNR